MVERLASLTIPDPDHQEILTTFLEKTEVEQGLSQQELDERTEAYKQMKSFLQDSISGKYIVLMVEFT